MQREDVQDYLTVNDVSLLPEVGDAQKVAVMRLNEWERTSRRTSVLSGGAFAVSVEGPDHRGPALEVV